MNKIEFIKWLRLMTANNQPEKRLGLVQSKNIADQLYTDGRPPFEDEHHMVMLAVNVSDMLEEISVGPDSVSWRMDGQHVLATFNAPVTLEVLHDERGWGFKDQDKS